MKNIFILIFTFFLSACATQIQKISQTPSGKPEVVVTNGNIPAIQNAIINDMVNFKYTVENQTESSLSMSRPGEGNDAFLAYFRGVGNSYSSTERIATYSFIKLENGIRVIATPAVRARMVGGQVNTGDLIGNPSIYNDYQKQLNEIKTKFDK